MKTIARILLFVGAVGLLSAGFAPTYGGNEAATPQPLVAVYDSLADTILGAKQAEWNLVHSILATTYSHAEGTLKKAQAKIKSGENAQAEIEMLAELVAQLGNEGDASVAAIRKRLLEGGHHHHSSGEKQGIYEEGYVIVTREAKKVFLSAATGIGKQGRAPDLAALDAEWAKVKQQFKALHPDAKH